MDELKVSQTVKRRSGGRLARQQERSRPLAADLKPVRPGLIGGRYQPLAPEQVAAISDTVFQILEEIGSKGMQVQPIEFETSYWLE